MKRVLAFGEILWDVIDGKPHLGGAPLNFAAHYAQCGGQSAILSKVGTDDLGQKALARLPEINVEKTFIQQDERIPTGTVTVTLNNGQPSYVIHENVAYDYIESPDASLVKGKFDAFYFGTLAQREPLSYDALRDVLAYGDFQEIFYDVNLRVGQFSKEIILSSLDYCSILKLNDEEVFELGELLFNTKCSFDQFASFLFENYSKLGLVIVTKGAEGCNVYQRGFQLVSVPSQKVKVQDTVGAGDSFSAAFTFCFLSGKSAIESATIANKVAGFVAASDGAIPTYSAEIKQLFV